MLRLAAATDPAWTTRVLDHLDELLLDHAHLEKKAAGTAVTLLFRYHGEYVRLALALFPEASVRLRIEALARDEANALAAGAPAPRLHG